MANPEGTYKKARVSGIVSYLNELGQRVGVPKGPCTISDNGGYGPFFLRWQSNGSKFQIELSLNEFSQYSNTKDFVILEP